MKEHSIQNQRGAGTVSPQKVRRDGVLWFCIGNQLIGIGTHTLGCLVRSDVFKASARAYNLVASRRQINRSRRESEIVPPIVSLRPRTSFPLEKSRSSGLAVLTFPASPYLAPLIRYLTLPTSLYSAKRLCHLLLSPSSPACLPQTLPSHLPHSYTPLGGHVLGHAF
jgi:hypothetical protein